MSRSAHSHQNMLIDSKFEMAKAPKGTCDARLRMRAVRRNLPGMLMLGTSLSAEPAKKA
jgi:hypothetical protein